MVRDWWSVLLRCEETVLRIIACKSKSVRKIERKKIGRRLQSVDIAIAMNGNGDFGIPVSDYTDTKVSTKVVKIIRSYKDTVNRLVLRKDKLKELEYGVLWINTINKKKLYCGMRDRKLNKKRL